MMPADDTVHGQLRSKVEAYLRDEGWQLESRAGAADTAWTYIATDAAGRKLVIGQRIARADLVVISGDIGLSEEHAAVLAAMPVDQREAFLTDLKLELLRAGLDYSGIEFPIQKITLIETCFLDGMNKDVFMRRVRSITRGVILVTVLCGSRL